MENIKYLLLTKFMLSAFRIKDLAGNHAHF